MSPSGCHGFRVESALLAGLIWVKAPRTGILSPLTPVQTQDSWINMYLDGLRSLFSLEWNQAFLFPVRDSLWLPPTDDLLPKQRVVLPRIHLAPHLRNKHHCLLSAPPDSCTHNQNVALDVSHKSHLLDRPLLLDFWILRPAPNGGLEDYKTVRPENS